MSIAMVYMFEIRSGATLARASVVGETLEGRKRWRRRGGTRRWEMYIVVSCRN